MSIVCDSCICEKGKQISSFVYAACRFVLVMVKKVLKGKLRAMCLTEVGPIMGKSLERAECLMDF